MLSLLHVEDRAPEFVGEHRERLRLSETRDQARVELLRPRVVAQEENGGLREGPLEVDVALLAAGSAPEFAGGFASRGHEPGVGGELLDGVEAIEVGDFVEDRHGEDLADPGHGAQAIEGGEVVALGAGDELALEIRTGAGQSQAGELQEKGSIQAQLCKFHLHPQEPPAGAEVYAGLLHGPQVDSNGVFDDFESPAAAHGRAGELLGGLARGWSSMP